jgi:CDP-diacylglycerol--glycerol-3-phosphate 3-phosphatidyltransferase
MNLPTKLTVARIVLSIVIIILLCFPFYELGISFPDVTIGSVDVNVKFLISGVLFLIASLTDYLDGHIARKRGLITNTGKMLDAIADKVLVNSVLIILAGLNEIHVIIPVIIVLRDILVNAIKMEAASRGKVVAAINSGKLKTAALMIGTTLVFFGNLPFELMGIDMANLFLAFATIMSIYSMIEYYNINKKLIMD